MKFKIYYNPTFSFSSADIFDSTDTPIYYEAWSRMTSEWAALCSKWIDNGAEDVEQALKIIDMAIVSVKQNGQEYPLAKCGGAKALRDSMEEQNPGYGNMFIKHLALGYRSLYFRRLEEQRKNLPISLPDSNGGENQE